MYGVFGKYVYVNLDQQIINYYAIPEDWYYKHIGGRGIAARILLEELPPRIEPFSPKNTIVFATGPLQGLNIAGSSRFVVMAKSPKTLTINDSYCGGRFGHMLGRSGYDGLIIQGKAKEPVYILIDDGVVKVLSAKNLWTFDPKRLEQTLTKEHGRVSIACIGVAGENMVMQSCIIVDRCRAIARPGYGALMGSKKLKAVAVRGSRQKPLANKKKLRSLSVQFGKSLVNTNPRCDYLHTYGTPGFMEVRQQTGTLPTKNFQAGQYDYHDQIDGRRLIKSGLLTGRATCPGCPVACKRETKGDFDGQEFDPSWGGPEYETIAAFGSLCLNPSLSSICLFNQKCNQYGLDTISVGVAIAYLMEATERGLLKSEEAIYWGDARAMNKLIDKIAHREGIGEWVARGVEYLGTRVGDSSFLVQIKGQEVPMHDPRGKLSMAVYYAMTPRGGNHMEGIHDPAPANPELGIGPVDRLGWENRAQVAGTYLNLQSFANSLILCAFTSSLAGTDYLFPCIREMLKASTGLSIDVQEMLKIGERNYGLLRLFAEREGYTRKDDDLPNRLKRALPDVGYAIEDGMLQRTIDDYYSLYDYKPYGPSNKRLRELLLEELIR